MRLALALALALTACIDPVGLPESQNEAGLAPIAPCNPGVPVASAVVNALQGSFHIQRGFTGILNQGPGYWLLELEKALPPWGVIIHATVNDDGFNAASAMLSPETTPSSMIEIKTIVINQGSPAEAYPSNQSFSISIYPVCQ